MSAGWEGDHLWLYVLALGFDPAVSEDDLTLGSEMFDNPNIRAFHVLALYLFGKLDQHHAEEVFRDCSSPVKKLMCADFRKQCFVWLKDIANEEQTYPPQITPFPLISPGGPKFIRIFYWFARHVVIADINSMGTDIPFAEAVKLRPKDMYMANARCRVARNKLLQIFQKEDFIMQEYKKKTQLLIKDIKEIKSEYAVLQMQSCKMKQDDQNKNDKTVRIQKVRSMWTLIVEILRSLKKEKEVVDSELDVLEGCVGQCVLDGTDVFSVPQLLARRVESDVHQLCTGSVYEAEKLNFLTVIELLNEALRALRDECCRQSELKEQLQVIENRISCSNKVLQDVEARRLKRQRLSVSISESISRNREDWKVKWKSFLGLCPFNLILDQNPELALRALPPHSHNLAEEEDEDSVFCQHLASLADVCDTVHEVCSEKDDEALETVMDKSTPPPRWTSSVPLELSEASEERDVFIEQNLLTETWKGKENPVPPKTLKNEENESTVSEMGENAVDHVIQTESPVNKEDPFNKDRDDLAEEVAKAVMSESPQEAKGMALEDLISSLAFNTFLTRKQIPRTPENLLTEIRSSWRKAIQTEGSSDTEQAQAEVMREEAPIDAGPKMQKVSDSGFLCSCLASPVPDFDPPLSERKSQLSSTEFRPQEQMRVSHIIESPILETSGLRESETTEKQELKCVVLNKSSVDDPEEQTLQYLGRSMSIPDISSENNSRTNVQPSHYFQGSLMDGMQHWSLSSLSSISYEATHLGMLDETLPEEFGNMNPNKSANSESDFDVIDSEYITSNSKNKDIQKSKLDLQPLLNTYKALKKAASRSEEERHQTHNGGESVSCRSDLSLAPEKERDELFNSVELFSLDEEFTKTPSPISLNERKYSLSSLLVSSQYLEEISSVIHEIPLDLIHKLKGKEQLNEKLGMKEPSSGWNL